MADRFPSPFEIQTPAGAEGWQELYTYSLPFSTDRREYEDSMFWFQDGVHWPEVLSPWDATFFEFALASLSQYNTRHYLIPPALGVDFRVLNGYAYLSPVGVADPAEIEARVPQFLERAGFYFQNWASLYEQWMGKIRSADRRDGGAQLRAPARRRGPGRGHRGPGHGLRLRAPAPVPPAGRPGPAAVAVPLRVPQPRLRRLPRLLRLLQAGLPQHPRPGHRQDGRRGRGRPVPARRGAEEAGPPGRRQPGRRRLRPAVGGGGDGGPAGQRRRAGVAVPVGGVGPAVVQLLGRERLLPHRRGVAGAPGDPVRVRARLHRQAARGGRHQPAHRGHPGRARPDRGRVRRAAGHRRGPGRLRAEARPGPGGVPLCREPQLLRRALEPLGAVAQDAPARRGPGQGGVLRRRGPTSSCSSGTRSPRPCGTTTAPGRSG